MLQYLLSQIIKVLLISFLFTVSIPMLLFLDNNRSHVTLLHPASHKDTYK